MMQKLPFQIMFQISNLHALNIVEYIKIFNFYFQFKHLLWLYSVTSIPFYIAAAFHTDRRPYNYIPYIIISATLFDNPIFQTTF